MLTDCVNALLFITLEGVLTKGLLSLHQSGLLTLGSFLRKKSLNGYS